MAADPDIDDLRQMIANIAESARELNDATRTIAETTRNQSNSSTIQIDAGGIPAGVAVGCGAVAVALVMMVAFWLMLNMSRLQAEVAASKQDTQDQMTAWVTVMQREVSKKEQAK